MPLEDSDRAARGKGAKAPAALEQLPRYRLTTQAVKGGRVDDPTPAKYLRIGLQLSFQHILEGLAPGIRDLIPLGCLGDQGT